jgi:hypothetical protein
MWWGYGNERGEGGEAGLFDSLLCITRTIFRWLVGWLVGW